MKSYTNLIAQEPVRQFVEKALKHEFKTWLPVRATVSPEDFMELVEHAAGNFEYVEPPDELGVNFIVNDVEHTVVIAPNVLQNAGSLIIE